MSDCLICGAPLPFAGNKTIDEGKICKNCTSLLPTFVAEKISNYSLESLQNIINIENDYYEQFSATASFGSLYIDEVHGLFAISKRMKGDKPEYKNVFSIYDLEEIGLYCKSPTADHGNVFVDVEFSCKLKMPDISIKEVVKKRCKCTTKRINSKEVEWQPPQDMEMFKTMFNYMLSGAFEKINKMLCGKSLKAIEIDRAAALFMIDDSYTLEYLDEVRMILLRAFDTGEKGCEHFINKINESYEILRKNINRNNF